MRRGKPKTVEIEAADDDTLVGYARVSTEEQNLDMQVEALRRAGVPAHAIHVEKVSGVAAKRPGLTLALKHCRPGMTFVVWKLDRVGRNLLDLLHFMQGLEKREIRFRSLQDSIDTSTPAGRVMLAMLGAFAQFERDLIAERTRAGVERAKARGVRFGRVELFTPAKRGDFEKLIAGGATVPEAAKRIGLAESTCRRIYTSAVLEAIRRRKQRKAT